jgi:hypothetical protein
MGDLCQESALRPHPAEAERHETRRDQQLAWHAKPWGAAAGVSLSTVNRLLKAGTPRYVKVGAATLITTSPAAFIAKAERTPPKLPPRKKRSGAAR